MYETPMLIHDEDAYLLIVFKGPNSSHLRWAGSKATFDANFIFWKDLIFTHRGVKRNFVIKLKRLNRNFNVFRAPRFLHLQNQIFDFFGS